MSEPTRDPRAPVYADRRDAGRRLAAALPADERASVGVVYGLARGGVPVAAEIAAALDVPLDALTVRKIGHPLQPELALGAVTAGGPPVVRAMPGEDPGASDALRRLSERRATEAAELDARLHESVPGLEPHGEHCVLVDDGLATGATMIAACRWALVRGARRVTVAIPVGSSDGVRDLRTEAGEVVCPVQVVAFRAVSVWYERFDQVSEDEVRELLADSRAERS